MAEDDPKPAIDCSLSSEQEVERAEQLSRTLGTVYLRSEDQDQGLTLVFEGTDDTLTAVATFVADELKCCSFADFSIEVTPPFEKTRLRITGPKGTTTMFREGLLPVLNST